MKSRYKFTEPDGIYFLTCSIQGWLPIFKDHKYCEIIINSLKFCRENLDLKLHAYVIMLDHIHLLVSGNNISNTIKSFKMYTATEIISNLKKDGNLKFLEKFKENKLAYKSKSTYQIWQEDSHPELAESENVCIPKMQYIHNNPVKKGYVSEPEMWKYSSAGFYVLGERGVIDIDDPFE